MKKKFINPCILSLLLTLPISSLAQLPLIEAEGDLNNRLAVLEATDVQSGGWDILELRMPASPTSTDGQYLECQTSASGIVAAINYDGSAFFDQEVNIGSSLLLDNSGTQSSSEILLDDTGANRTVAIRSRDAFNTIGGEILLYGPTGSSTIEIDGNWAGSGKGRIIVDEMQIKGGADIAENFDLSASDGPEKAEAGMLVSIDPNEPGKLKIATEAYDTKVAGVVSGANGVNTGFYMGQKGSEADGAYPIALAGRVYVKADASFGSIQPGDLLTTSPTEGHAMKVKKHKKAQGAVVGKAMSSLEDGQGYVLVLINLQ